MGLWTLFLPGNLMQNPIRAAGKARMGLVENSLRGNRRVQRSGKKTEKWFFRILFKVMPLMSASMLLHQPNKSPPTDILTAPTSEQVPPLLPPPPGDICPL